MTETRITPDFDAWRDAARHLLMQHVPPGRVLWRETDDPQPLLPLATPSDDLVIPRIAKRGGVRVPKTFVDLARRAACHRDPDRWSLLYRVLWRLATAEPDLLTDPTDPDTRRLQLLNQQVSRDLHKMHAFVRFREVGGARGQGSGDRGQREDQSAFPQSAISPPPHPTSDIPHPTSPPPQSAIPSSDPRNPQPATRNSPSFAAWYEPDHRIVRLAAPFFAERFATLNWTILTPDECVAWDGHALRFSPGVPKSQAPTDDAAGLEQLWCAYYASIFNPARIKTDAMKKEMPRRFWKNLPEAAQIDDLLASAPTRVDDMMARSAASARADAYPTAKAFLPPAPHSLPQLAQAASACRGCHLCEHATQTVFGVGPATARLVLVGEQPGDHEDTQGTPFVGPAGQLLDEALATAGLDRSTLYLTNAVKHFKFELKGKRRIHAKPGAREIHACRPWLEAELHTLRPPMILALGATAAQSMLGPAFRLTTFRGRVFTDTEWSPWWMATLHPSALLRIPDPALRDQAKSHFLQDLRTAAEHLRTL